MKYFLLVWITLVSCTAYTQTSVEVLARQLTAHQSNDSLKVVAIFDWITQHIYYDVNAYNERLPTATLGDSQTSAVVLQEKKAICGGYANLFYDLCRAAGIEVCIVEGLGKVQTSDFPQDTRTKIEDHAWNAVKINRYWYLADLTWSAGIMYHDQFYHKPTRYFFLSKPAFFLQYHYPYDPLWQLSDRIITEKDFLKGPPFTPHGKFPKDSLLQVFETLDSTARLVNTQLRILQHDANNYTANNTMGFHYAMRSVQLLQQYTRLLRVIRTEKVMTAQLKVALTYRDKLYDLLKQAEEELNIALTYYNRIAPEAPVKGVEENKRVIFLNLEGIQKDRARMNQYYTALSKAKK